MYAISGGAEPDFDGTGPTRAESDFARLKEQWRRADEAVAGLSFDDTFEFGGATALHLTCP
jgi:hypothetical protein